MPPAAIRLVLTPDEVMVSCLPCVRRISLVSSCHKIIQSKLRNVNQIELAICGPIELAQLKTDEFFLLCHQSAAAMLPSVIA